MESFTIAPEKDGRWANYCDGRYEGSSPDRAGAERSAEFGRQFWNEKIAIKDDPRVARVSGTHYQIGDENAKGMRGFGGARAIIRFHDGRVVESSNLWTQGQIPLAYRDQLPDNAELEWK